MNFESLVGRIKAIRLFSTAVFQSDSNQKHTIWQACLPNYSSLMINRMKKWRMISAKSQAKIILRFNIADADRKIG